MKNLLIILFTFLSISGFSQTDLKGPKYKNSKQKYDKESTIVVKKDKNNIKGPKYKNKKHDKENVDYVEITGRKEKRLKGPKYKNQK
jgi:hypothetical protein